jgi:peroxiredoxin
MLNVFGQNIEISGIVVGSKNQIVRLISVEDQFSMQEKTIATTLTDEEGGFWLKSNINGLRMTLVAVDLKKAEIFLKAGDNVHLRFLEDTSADNKSIYEQSPLQYEFLTPNALNTNIQNFNIVYNTFLLRNFNKLSRSRSNKLIVDFKHETDSAFGKSDSPFFKDYRRYKIASLELASRKKDENKLISEYFINNKILYNNIEYCSLFKEVFSNYLLSGKSGINYAKLIETVNYSTNYKLYDNLISQGNTQLASDNKLRELIGIIGLAKFYNTRGFNRNNVIKLLRQVERNSIYDEHRIIAGNYILKLQKLIYGSPCPRFSLKSQEGRVISIDSLRGKFTLLMFMKENSQICLSHISMIDEIRQMFNSKLQIVSLVKGNALKINNFMYERDYEWPTASIDDILLLEKFNIKVFPSYVLLNPDGSIASATAPMPDENLAPFINSLMKKWDKKP